MNIGCPRKKEDLGYEFVVPTLILNIQMQLSDKMRLVYDSQANTDE